MPIQHLLDQRWMLPERSDLHERQVLWEHRMFSQRDDLHSCPFLQHLPVQQHLLPVRYLWMDRVQNRLLSFRPKRIVLFSWHVCLPEWPEGVFKRLDEMRLKLPILWLDILQHPMLPTKLD